MQRCGAVCSKDAETAGDERTRPQILEWGQQCKLYLQVVDISACFSVTYTARGRGWPAETRPIAPHALHLDVVYIGRSHKYERWVGCGWPLKQYMVLPNMTCLIMPNLVALGQTIWAYIGSHKLRRCWFPWDVMEWCGWLRRITLLVYTCYVSHSVILGPSVWTQLWRFAGKIWPLLSCLSRSLEPTRIDRLPVSSC